MRDRVHDFAFCSFAVACVLALAGPALAGPMSGQLRNKRVSLADDDGREPPVRLALASFGTAIEQGSTQPDPTALGPILFDVTFGQAIDPATFEPSDLVQNGTAAVGGWIITDLGDQRRFSMAANVVGSGTVVPTIGAGAVEDPTGAESNSASVSVDNSVTFGPVACSTRAYLYVGIWSPPEIYIYCIEPSGLLTFQEKLAAPSDVRDMQGSADGKSLYYATADLVKYTVSTDGSLVLAGTRTVGDGTFDDLLLDPAGRFLYGTHSQNGGKVFVYDTAIVSNSAVQIQEVPGFFLPAGLAIPPDGDTIHVANNFPQEIVSFGLLADGRLDLGDFSQTGFTARAAYFAVHPTLDLLYWTEVPGGSVLTGLAPGVGVSFVDSIFSGFGARSLTIDGSGSRLYVANNNTDDVTVLSLDGSGEAGFQELEPTERRPEHVILGLGDDRLYVASAGDGAAGPSHVSIYDVLPGGSLAAFAPVVIPSQGAYRMAIVDVAP